jgi:hypothetical protein
LQGINQRASETIYVYVYSSNSPISLQDPYGLSTVSLDCGTTHNAYANALGAVHCAVVIACAANHSSRRIEIGGTRTGGTPPFFDKPQPYPNNITPSAFIRYKVNCANDKNCCCAYNCIEQAASDQPRPPYNPYTGPNSNTFAHNLLKKCGCSLAPYLECFATAGEFGVVYTTCVTATEPKGAVGW